MNSYQRRKLKRKIANTVCPNCGEKGPHFIQAPPFSWSLNVGVADGFWTCNKCYGPDGKRLPEYTNKTNIGDTEVLSLITATFDVMRNFKPTTNL